MADVSPYRKMMFTCMKIGAQIAALCFAVTLAFGLIGADEPFSALLMKSVKVAAAIFLFTSIVFGGLLALLVMLGRAGVNIRPEK